MQSRTVKKCLKEIVSPSLSELGFQLRGQVTVERERIWCYWKVINGEKCEIIFRVSILNTITVDLIIPPMIQISLVDVDPQASFDTKMWGYRFDSEEQFREQLKALTGLLLEKGVPRLEQMANRGKPGPYA